MTPTANPQGNATPRVSVIIPTRNRVDFLKKCLESIEGQLSDVPLIEVLVCDDSDDPSSRYLIESSFPFAQWIKGPGKGPGPNRNTGAANSKGDLLVFVDDDCIPQPGWLRAYCKVLDDDNWNRAVYAGPIRWPEGIASLAWEAPLNESSDGIPSCNFAIPRERFLEMGGFDTRYSLPSFEDTELHARLLAEGVRVEFLTDAVVYHPPRRLPDAASMAARWYPQVIYALDLGAPPESLYFPYLRHVAGTTLGRWRSARPRIENFAVLPRYVATVILVAVQLPAWIRKAAAGPRSKFWESQERRHGVPRYGFGALIRSQSE